MSSGPELVLLIVLTATVIEIELPCGTVVRVSNADRSLRRMLGILLKADQTAEVSPIAEHTTCIDHSTGSPRRFERLAVCRDLSVFSRPKCIVSYRKPA